MKRTLLSFLILTWVLSPGPSLASSQNDDTSYKPANRKAREKSFQKLDRDKDELITAQEWRGDVQTFLSLDCNKDQILSREEFIYVDCKLDRKEIAFIDLDRNNNKVIEPDEWNRPEEDFQRLDKDHDGILTRSEFFPSKKTQILKDILGQIVVSP